MTTQQSRLVLSVDSRGARTNVNALDRDLKRVTTTGNETAVAARNISRSFALIGTAAASIAGVSGFGKLVGDLQQLQSINARIGNLTGDLANQQQFLQTTARELSAEYITLAGSYSRLLPLYDAQILSLAEAQEITRGLANVQAATGASSADLGRSIFGLAQGLSAGTLRAEELNQVTEALPGLLQSLDRAAGLAGGGFRRLVNDGEVTSDFFRDTLLVALQDYEGVAASLSGNIEQTFNRTRNAYLDALAAFEQPLSDVALGGAEALAEVFVAVGNNADEITDALTVLSGVAVAVFGGRALAGAAGYAVSLRNTALAARAAQIAEIDAARGAVAAAQTRQAAAVAANTQAQATLREAQAANVSATGFARLTAVQAQVTAARTASAASAAQLAAAQTAAVAATGRLVTAQRAVTVSATAMAVAMRAGSASLALFGGPAGAALLAAGGLAFFALRQTEAEKTAEELARTIDSLSDAFYRNTDAGREAAIQTEAAIIARINDAEAILDNIERLSNESGTLGNAWQRVVTVFELGEARENVNALRESLQDLRDEAARLERENQQIEFFSFADRAREQVQEATAGIAAEAADVRAAIEGLFPENEKIERLENLQNRLEGVRNSLSPEEYARGAAAIQRELEKITGAQEASAEAAEDLRGVLESALPEVRRNREYRENIDLLTEAMRRGGDDADLYRRAIAALREEFNDESARLAAEGLEELNTALERRVNDPFAGYRADLALFRQALQDGTGDASAIQTALSNTAFEIRTEFSTIGQAETEAEAVRLYQRNLSALQEFHQAANVEDERAALDRIALERSTANTIEEIRRNTQQRLAELTGAEAGVLFDIQVSSDTSDLQNLLDQNLITQNQFNSASQDLARRHEEELNEIIRAGNATREQLQGANFNQRLAAFQAYYSEEINLATSAVDALLDSRVARNQREADAALQSAQNDAQIAADALREFERSGTEQNRLAAEQAAERARISEEAARREFEQQKRAQLEQARLSQALAVINAFATGGNFLTGTIYAGIAFRRTQDLIDDIESRQFNGGSPVNGNTGGVPTVSDTPNATNSGQAVTVNNFFTDDTLIDNTRLGQRMAQVTRSQIDNDELRLRPRRGGVDLTLDESSTTRSY